MASSKEDTLKVASAVGYTISNADLDDYTTLLDKARQLFEQVDALDGEPQ